MRHFRRIGVVVIYVLFKLNTVQCSAVDCYTQIDPHYWTVDVPSQIHITTDADAKRIRNDIIRYLWPEAGWPAHLPTVVTRLSKDDSDERDAANIPDWISTIGSDNLDEVDRIDIRMDYELHSYVYHLHPHPKRKINRLLIFHMGHSDDILTAGGRETIRYFLAEGFSILTFWMPLFGENTRTAQNVPDHGTHTFSSGTAGHDAMSSVLENSKGSFIRFFIEPVIVALNYVETQFDYGDINMAGISGGGWTTHLCAALDARIKLSFPVAGSLPLYLRSGPCPNGSKGDAEQEWPALYEHIASWLDIYILGSYGRGRGQVHILNQYDSCCFWGINYRTFQPIVTEAVNALGEGFYYLYLDSSHKEHKISHMAIEEVMAQYLLSCGLRHEGDLNNDCVINLEDIVIMASDWLACGDSSIDCP